MLRDRNPLEQSEFLKYLARHSQSAEDDRLPPLADLSRELGISIASLREQLEVARAMGLVEGRPKTGIRRLEYRFEPAVVKSVVYAMSIEPHSFEQFSDLRNHVETAYWFQAVSQLNSEDHAELLDLVRRAFQKLDGSPVQIPHMEHRQLHLLLYSRLNNPFVTGIMETYWDIYEAVGLSVYNDLNYLRRVWTYHQKIVEAVCAGDLNGGYQLLVEHIHLITERTKPSISQKFE